MVRVGPPYPEDFHCSGQSKTHLRPEEVASGLDKFTGRIIHKLCVGKTLQTKGGTKKSGPGVKSSNSSANIGPIETYYIPN